MYDRMYADDEPARSGALGKFTFLLLMLQAIGILGVAVYLIIINLLPVAHLSGVCAIFIICWLLQYFLLYKSKNVVKAKRIFSIILSFLFISVIIAIFWYLGGFISVFNSISKNKEEYDIYSIRVLKNSGMDSINDIKGKTIGVSELTSEDDMTKCMEDLTGKLGSKPATRSYAEDDALAEALMNKNTDVILFDEAVLNSVEENREGFTEATKIIYEIKVPASKVTSNTKRTDIDVNQDSFNVFITGMDSSGKIAARGNSDVNILATINPKTKKILLTTTPRDFYVPLEGNKNKYDKLTHAGNYGADCSMSTIAHLYDTPVDFYIKVNFTSVEGLVDALGGVTVNSDIAFSAPLRTGGRTSFTAGPNKLDGARALAYSRERKSLAGGDRARGKHQQDVISAIIDKMTSPAMLSNYNKVLKVIEQNTTTDISTDQMTSLIKSQIKNPSSWKVESISVDGVGDRKFTYSYKKKQVYVMIPTESTVTAAKAKIAEYMK